MNRPFNMFFIGLIGISGIFFICRCSDSADPSNIEAIPVYRYKVVNTYPHNQKAFTQGLTFENGFLYEGTGLYGMSALHKVELETGKTLQIRKLQPRFFGEGLTIFSDEIIQLTWRSNVGFVYDKYSFEIKRKFNYLTEGWGITHDGMRLIMSDGTATLHFLDPITFEEIGQIEVHENKRLVSKLNELEFVREKIYANVWKSNRIAIIEPETGEVVGWIDLEGILNTTGLSKYVDVLNGIAYDAEDDRLFVTGKLWPKLFEIELVDDVQNERKNEL